jgi:hypothetical protein
VVAYSRNTGARNPRTQVTIRKQVDSALGHPVDGVRWTQESAHTILDDLGQPADPGRHHWHLARRRLERG